MGATFALSSIAGCTEDGGDTESTPTPTLEPGAGSGAEPGAGGVTFSVDPSAKEIDWGDEYTVTVTAQAGDDPPAVGTGIMYGTEGSSRTGTVDNSGKQWMLDAGESQTETFEIDPPSVSEFTFRLMTGEQEVVAEWELTVNPPVQSFGETLSYYDGLDMTIDVELHEWLDFELLEGDMGEELGPYSVRPEDGQWVKVNIVAENTNMNTDVGIPEGGAFSALAGNSQLDHPRYLGTNVGAGTEYEVDDETRHEEGAWLEMNDGGEPGQEGFWLPQNDLVPGAGKEGWVLFETDTDATKDDLQIRCGRNDIRATWE